jgi:hypothetical protein
MSIASRPRGYSDEEIMSIRAVRRLPGGADLQWLVYLWLDFAHSQPATFPARAMRRAAMDAMCDVGCAAWETSAPPIGERKAVTLPTGWRILRRGKASGKVLR